MLSMGKSTISMVIFNSYVTNYQRVRYLLVNLMVIQNGLLDSWPVPLLSFAPFRWLSRHSQWTRRTCRCFGKLGIPGIPRNLLAIMAIWNAKVWFQTIRPWGITVGLGKHRSGVSNPCRDAAMQHLGLTSNRGKAWRPPEKLGRNHDYSMLLTSCSHESFFTFQSCWLTSSFFVAWPFYPLSNDS